MPLHKLGGSEILLYCRTCSQRICQPWGQQPGFSPGHWHFFWHSQYPHACLAPVHGQGCGEGGVKCPNVMPALVHHLLLGGLERHLQLRWPGEWCLAWQEVLGGQQDRAGGKGVGHLGEGTKPGPNIGQAGRCGEVEDWVDKAVGWSDTVHTSPHLFVFRRRSGAVQEHVLFTCYIC